MSQKLLPLRRCTRIGKHQAGEASREPLPDETSPGTAATTPTVTLTTPLAITTPPTTATTSTSTPATPTVTLTTPLAITTPSTVTTPPTGATPSTSTPVTSTVTLTTPLAITTPPTTATTSTSTPVTSTVTLTTLAIATTTTPASAVTILTRAATGTTITPATDQGIPEYRSLAQRIADYQRKRHEIFSAEISRRRALTRRHGKILILRQRRQTYKRFQREEVSAIVSLEHDDRLFARTKVDNTEVTALLDTGASVSCCGAGATRFLENRRHRVVRLQNRHVNTANGEKTSVTGLITLPVEWEGETRSIEFYIVPALQQQFYFGIDFWKAFGLSVATKADTIKSPNKCQALDTISQGNDNSKSYRNSSLQLTDVKLTSLGEGKETLPHNTREKFSGSIEITSSTSPLRNRRQQKQQSQLNNAETTIAVVSHRNQLLPSATAISDIANHAKQNELAKRTRISENLSSQHSTRKSSRRHPPATTVTATAQHRKSCSQPAPQAYINQAPINLASSGRSTMINRELKFSTNTSSGSNNDGSSSRTPFDLATEALRGSRPIDRERLLNLLQRIANESQEYRMQNQLLKGLLDLRNGQIRQLSHKVQVR
ncbi:uncharacterized protein ACN427_002632 [Glossina fuscipes fuscipes]